MKKILKTPEPRSFTEHKTKKPASFDGLSLAAKDDLRNSLLNDQGNICCYCMKRIPEKDNKMKVEHFLPQSKFPKLQLKYTNLFGACLGNEGKPKEMHTCDTKKGHEELKISLISNSPSCELLYKINPEGRMSSINDDEEYNRQINNILNLNMQTLVEGRREVYLEVQRNVEEESKKLLNKDLKVSYFERERSRWLNRTDNTFRPYCMVAVYFLTKKIRQSA
jgi:uncharacterized protein (TIGR02646 family)